MDYLQFIDAIIGRVVSLAWPAAIVACVWLFRQELKTLLPLLKLKHGETEVGFITRQAEKEIADIEVKEIATDHTVNNGPATPALPPQSAQDNIYETDSDLRTRWKEYYVRQSSLNNRARILAKKARNEIDLLRGVFMQRLVRALGKSEVIVHNDMLYPLGRELITRDIFDSERLKLLIDLDKIYEANADSMSDGEYNAVRNLVSFARGGLRDVIAAEPDGSPTKHS